MRSFRINLTITGAHMLYPCSHEQVTIKVVCYLVKNEGKLNYCVNQYLVVKGSDVVIKHAMRECCT